MKANLLKTSFASLLWWMVMVLHPSPAAAQVNEWFPLMEITGIGMNDPDSLGRYLFYPIVRDIDFLSGTEQQEYTYVWDFGNGIYSLEAMPLMKFDRDLPTEVTLRVTGLKEIKDPDARQTRPVMNNCEVSKIFTGYTRLARSHVDRPELKPEVRFFQPSHAPVPSKCADFLIQWDFAERKRYHGEFDLQGLVAEGGNDPWMEIRGFEATPGMDVTRDGNNGLHIKFDNFEDRTFQLLVHCRFSESAKVGNMFRWNLTGKFKPPFGSLRETVEVSQQEEYRVEGSLDPPRLTSGSPEWVEVGDTVTWEMDVKNEGNASESYIEIIDTLPIEFDLLSLRTESVLWAGKEFEPEMVIDTANRVVKWILNNSDAPLEPGAHVVLKFRVVVAYRKPCPPNIHGCQDQYADGHLIAHRAYSMFYGEQMPGVDRKYHCTPGSKMVVSCVPVCAPKPLSSRPIYAAWFPMALSGLVVVSLLGFMLYLLFGRRTRRRLRMRAKNV